MSEEKGGGFSLLKFDGKPIEKLIETVSAGIGVLYKPRAIRKEAEARAYEMEVLANADAKSSIIKYDAENEIAERARQRLYHQEMQRQINLDNIVAGASELLNEDVSDEPVDADWRTRFFNKAQDITSEELQNVWARILANEVNEPGTFSLRTLDILSNLSKKEADLFNRFLTLCDSNGRVYKLEVDNLQKYNFIYEDLLSLRSAGLLHTSETLSIQCNNYSDEEQCVTMKIHYNTIKINLVKNEAKTFDLGCYVLTTSGVELLNVLDIKTDEEYIKELTDQLSKKGFTILLIS